ADLRAFLVRRHSPASEGKSVEPLARLKDLDLGPAAFLGAPKAADGVLYFLIAFLSSHSEVDWHDRPRPEDRCGIHRLLRRQDSGSVACRLLPTEARTVDGQEGHIERSMLAGDPPPAAVPERVATMEDPAASDRNHPGNLRISISVGGRHRCCGEVADDLRLPGGAWTGSDVRWQQRRRRQGRGISERAPALQNLRDGTGIIMVRMPMRDEHCCLADHISNRSKAVFERGPPDRSIRERIDEERRVLRLKPHARPSEALAAKLPGHG